MNQEKIGEFLKKLRKDNNLTQAELADKLGVTYQAVSKWENGKNIPDIAILQEISKIFDVNVDEIISGKKTKKTNKKDRIALIIIFSLVIVALIVIIILSMNRSTDTSISEIEAKCEKFKVSGTLVYSKDKTYIHIPVITFCEPDDTVYDKIEYVLYEKIDDTTIKISGGENVENTTLKDYLENLKIHADNYKNVCSNLDKLEIYLEISATKDEKVTSYKVPLEVSKTCTK